MAAKGVADFVCGTDEALVERIRGLMAVLPYNMPQSRYWKLPELSPHIRTHLLK